MNAIEIIAAVETVHRRAPGFENGPEACAEDGQAWPCSTIQALQDASRTSLKRGVAAASATAAWVLGDEADAEPITAQMVIAAYEAGLIRGRTEGAWLASNPKPKHPRLSVVTKSTSRPGFCCSHCGSTDPGAA